MLCTFGAIKAGGSADVIMREEGGTVLIIVEFKSSRKQPGTHALDAWFKKVKEANGTYMASLANAYPDNLLAKDVFQVNLYVHAIKQIFGNPISSCLAAVLVLFLLVLLTCVV